MARYEITFADGFGRELDTMILTAGDLAAALGVSGDLLRDTVRDGRHAVSATVELLGVYDCEPEDVDESAGMRELHSVRAELHADELERRAEVERIQAALDRDEYGLGLGDFDGGSD